MFLSYISCLVSIQSFVVVWRCMLELVVLFGRKTKKPVRKIFVTVSVMGIFEASNEETA